MRLRRSPLLLAGILLAACSSSTPKPADGPADDAAGAAPTGATTSTEKIDEPPPPPPGALKSSTVKDDSIPDDYDLTPGDCDALGKQYGRLARSDQMAGVSPKLSAEQREKAEANIDRAIAPLESRWIDGCVASLVGKATDRKLLKCAMEAKTVKAFDVCLNGEGGSPPEAKAGPGAKKKK